MRYDSFNNRSEYCDSETLFKFADDHSYGGSTMVMLLFEKNKGKLLFYVYFCLFTATCEYSLNYWHHSSKWSCYNYSIDLRPG
jgi:hypothetical protein